MRPARIASVQRLGLPTTPTLPPELAQVGQRAMHGDALATGVEEDAVARGEALARFADTELEDARVVPRPGRHVRSQRIELRPPIGTSASTVAERHPKRPNLPPG